MLDPSFTTRIGTQHGPHDTLRGEKVGPCLAPHDHTLASSVWRFYIFLWVCVLQVLHWGIQSSSTGASMHVAALDIGQQQFASSNGLRSIWAHQTTKTIGEKMEKNRRLFFFLSGEASHIVDHCFLKDHMGWLARTGSQFRSQELLKKRSILPLELSLTCAYLSSAGAFLRSFFFTLVHLGVDCPIGNHQNMHSYLKLTSRSWRKVVGRWSCLFGAKGVFSRAATSLCVRCRRRAVLIW